PVMPTQFATAITTRLSGSVVIWARSEDWVRPAVAMPRASIMMNVETIATARSARLAGPPLTNEKASRMALTWTRAITLTGRTSPDTMDVSLAAVERRRLR